MDIKKVISPNRESRYGWKPDIIVCHITEGSASSAINWFANPASEVSAHFVVSKTGEVTQCVPIEETAWANPTRTDPSANSYYGKSEIKAIRERKTSANYYSVSIEHEGIYSQTGGALAPAQLKASIELIQHIRKEVKRIYGITIPIDREHIIGHYQTNKVDKINCPGRKFQWDEIIAGVKKLDGQTVTPAPSKAPGTPNPTLSLSKVAKQYLGQTGEKFIEWNTGTMTWDDWCAYFGSYCIYETYGVVRKFGFVDEVVEGMTQIPGPEKDCLVWYDRNNNKRGDHIGICSYAQGSNFTVIEGNTKNDDNSKSIVSENSYHTSDLPFRFYRIPDSMKKPAEPIKGKPMKVTLPEDTAVYRSVEETSTGKNPVIYKAGEYNIYRTFGEFVNITKTTLPGGWIKLRGIK